MIARFRVFFQKKLMNFFLNLGLIDYKSFFLSAHTFFLRLEPLKTTTVYLIVFKKNHLYDLLKKIVIEKINDVFET